MHVETDFLDHWKTQLMRDRLGGSIAVEVILRIWAHCQLRKTARFTMPAEAWKYLCRWPGPADQLISALLDSGFLERTDAPDTYIVHDWEKTNRYLIQAWENGGKGGRPAGSKKPDPNQTETDRFPSGSRPDTDRKPPGNRTRTVGEPINTMEGKGMEGNGRGGNAPPPENSSQDRFPKDGVPYRLAELLRRICPDLADKATPDAIANGPWLVSRNHQLPWEEWQHAAEEFAQFLNGGGEIKPGKTWQTTLGSFIGNRFTQWDRDRVIRDRIETRLTGNAPDVSPERCSVPRL